MEPITGSFDEPARSAPVEPRSASRATQLGAVERDDAQDAPSIEAESGTLAEVESLRGVLITGPAEGEVVALRRSLELDDRLETAQPTTQEQVQRAEALRRAVTEPASSPSESVDGTTDPTERFEVHSSAVTGDAIAQAIEEADAERDDVNTVAEERQDDDLRADAAAQDVRQRRSDAVERFGLEQADAEAASAARAVLSDAVAAAGAVLARERDEGQLAERAIERTDDGEAAAARADGVERDDERRASDAARLRRAANERAGGQQLDEDVQREDASLLADTRLSQLAASAGSVQFGSGRPPAQFEDRGDENERDDAGVVERVERVERPSGRVVSSLETR